MNALDSMSLSSADSIPLVPVIPMWVEKVAHTGKVLSWISVVALFIPIATFLVFKTKRQYPSRLPLYMSISVLGVNLSTLIGFYHHKSFCPYQSIGIELFGNAAVVWWLIISLNFFQVAVRDRNEQKLERWYLLLGCGLPIVLTLTSWFTHALDRHPLPGRWECWMSNPRGTGQWIYFYGWMGAACLAGIVVWPKIIMRFYHIHRRADEVVVQYIRHFLFFLLFFIVFAVMFVYRIYTEEGHTTYSLVMAHTVCVCSTGIYMAVVFGLTRQNFSLWRDLLCCSQRKSSVKPYGTSSSPLLRPYEQSDSDYGVSSAGAVMYTP